MQARLPKNEPDALSAGRGFSAAAGGAKNGFPQRTTVFRGRPRRQPRLERFFPQTTVAWGSRCVVAEATTGQQLTTHQPRPMDFSPPDRIFVDWCRARY